MALEFPYGYTKLLNIPHIKAISDAADSGLFTIWGCKDQEYCENVTELKGFGINVYRFHTGSEIVGEGEHQYPVPGIRVKYRVLMDNNPDTIPGFYIHHTQFDALKAWIKSKTEFDSDEMTTTGDYVRGENTPIRKRRTGRPFNRDNNGSSDYINLGNKPIIKGGRRHTRNYKKSKRSKPVRKHKRRTHRQRSRR